MLVYEAIGKNINPTRYRQIVETESSDRLFVEEQRIISEDQKHSSNIAKVYYKKKQSRTVAVAGKKCMEKMTESSRGGKSVMDLYNEISSEFDPEVLNLSQRIIEGNVPGTSQQCTAFDSATFNNLENDPYQPVIDEENDSESKTDITVTKSTQSQTIPSIAQTENGGANITNGM